MAVTPLGTKPSSLTSTSAPVIPLPGPAEGVTDILAGDLLVIDVQVNSTVTVGPGTSGFQVLTDSDGDQANQSSGGTGSLNGRSYVFGKIADGTEDGTSVTLSLSFAGRVEAFATVFRGNASTVGAVVYDVVKTGSGGASVTTIDLPAFKAGAPAGSYVHCMFGLNSGLTSGVFTRPTNLSTTHASGVSGGNISAAAAGVALNDGSAFNVAAATWSVTGQQSAIGIIFAPPVNQPPVGPGITLVSPAEPHVGDTVLVQAAGFSDPEGATLTYTWGWSVLTVATPTITPVPGDPTKATFVPAVVGGYGPQCAISDGVNTITPAVGVPVTAASTIVYIAGVTGASNSASATAGAVPGAAGDLLVARVHYEDSSARPTSTPPGPIDPGVGQWVIPAGGTVNNRSNTVSPFLGMVQDVYIRRRLSDAQEALLGPPVWTLSVVRPNAVTIEAWRGVDTSQPVEDLKTFGQPNDPDGVTPQTLSAPAVRTTVPSCVVSYGFSLNPNFAGQSLDPQGVTDRLTVNQGAVVCAAVGSEVITAATTSTTVRTATIGPDAVNGAGRYVSTSLALRPAQAVNLPPTADAGPDQVKLAGNTITLNGGGSSDPEGAALTYVWSQVPDQNLPFIIVDPITTATGTIPTSAAPLDQGGTPAGVYRFKLVVSDGTYQSAPDFVDITVQRVGTFTRMAVRATAPERSGTVRIHVRGHGLAPGENHWMDKAQLAHQPDGWTPGGLNPRFAIKYTDDGGKTFHDLFAVLRTGTSLDPLGQGDAAVIVDDYLAPPDNGDGTSTRGYVAYQEADFQP